MTVLFPAGTSADVTARALASGMAKQLGVNIAVVNRPGAGGAIGYKHVAAQKPDGYSIVWNSNSISTTYHSGQLPFDYRHFEPVARALVESVVVAVRSDSKWKSLKDLVADAKSRPGEITLADVLKARGSVGTRARVRDVLLNRIAVDAWRTILAKTVQITGECFGDVLDEPADLGDEHWTTRVLMHAAKQVKRDPDVLVNEFRDAYSSPSAFFEVAERLGKVGSDVYRKLVEAFES